MTINERVSPETLDKIIEAADDFITALAVTTEDDSTNMRQLLDGVKALNATPEIVKQMCEIFKAMARELQQYRAAAEPVYQVWDWHWYDAEKHVYDEAVARGDECRVLYAAPQVTSVPDERPSLNNGIVGFDEGWNACRAAMLTAAPAVQAEQLSGNTEQVEPVSDANKLGGWIPVSDRMPDIGTEIFYFCQDDGLRDCAIVSSSNFSGGGDAQLYVHAEGYDLRFGVDITHWMQLPAAPKQEAE